MPRQLWRNARKHQQQEKGHDGMNTEGLTVIIDNGIGDSAVKQYRVNENGMVVLDQEIRQKYSHGTACFRMFTRAAARKNCISLRIEEGKDGYFKCEHLLAALEWCCKNPVRLISISMGTCIAYDFWKFEPVLERLKKREVIVVAAMDNRNRITCPASLESVTGVQIDRKLGVPKDEFVLLEENLLGANIRINPGNQDVYCFPENSYAAPYFAGLLQNALDREEVTFASLQKWIRGNAYQIERSPGCEEVEKVYQEEPIHLAVLESECERGQVHAGKVFSKKQYTPAELVVKEENVRWELVNRNISYEMCPYLINRIRKSINPDVIIWYVSDRTVFYRLKVNFDAVIAVGDMLERNKKLMEYCKDAVILRYSEADLCEEHMVQDICSLF